MLIRSISLSHFRNFAKATFSLSPDLTLIVGENAKGKTSLLEAVYTAVYGTGFRESRELELIQWEQKQSFVEAQFIDHDIPTMFQVVLQKEGENRVKKSFYVNKTPKSFYQYHQLQMQAVLFAPQQIEIVTGSPSRRRVYLDTVLSSFDFDYRKSLRNYENALRKRNKIFEHYVNESLLEEELSFWNNYLIEQSAVVVRKRQEYVNFLNDHPHVHEKKFSIEYVKNEFTFDLLKKVYHLELRMRRTMIGPQKDDFLLFLHTDTKKDVSLYGSRSEQRMAIFWLKLNELTLFEKSSNIRPILLLDDIFSELDLHNRELVMGMLRNYQTIATTTEEDVKELTDMPEVVINL